jgi:hypothetical protein
MEVQNQWWGPKREIKSKQNKRKRKQKLSSKKNRSKNQRQGPRQILTWEMLSITRPKWMATAAVTVASALEENLSSPNITLKIPALNLI